MMDSARGERVNDFSFFCLQPTLEKSRYVTSLGEAKIHVVPFLSHRLGGFCNSNLTVAGHSCTVLSNCWRRSKKILWVCSSRSALTSSYPINHSTAPVLLQVSQPRTILLYLFSFVSSFGLSFVNHSHNL